MGKVLSVFEKKSKDGLKTFYSIAIKKDDGTTIGAVAFDPLKEGDEIPDSRIVPDKSGEGWIVRSENRTGKGSYQRNEEMIVAQCVFKGIVDLSIAGQLQMFDPDRGEYYQETLTNLGIQMGKTILNISRAFKCSQPVAKPPEKPVEREAPKLGEKPKVITTSKELFNKTKELGWTPSDCQKVKGFAVAVNANNYDLAWDLIQKAMEPKGG